MQLHILLAHCAPVQRWILYWTRCASPYTVLMCTLVKVWVKKCIQILPTGREYASFSSDRAGVGIGGWKHDSIGQLKLGVNKKIISKQNIFGFAWWVVNNPDFFFWVDCCLFYLMMCFLSLSVAILICSLIITLIIRKSRHLSWNWYITAQNMGGFQMYKV